jgi:hypothetical protein
VDQVRFRSQASAFGLVPGSFTADLFDAPYPFGAPVRQAGAHPFELRVGFDLNERTGIDPSDHLRYTLPHGLLADAAVGLPVGIVGNPQATPRCSPLDFVQSGLVPNSTQCPPNTQIGYINVFFSAGTTQHGEGGLDPASATRVPLYNVVPPKNTPADFAFSVGGYLQGNVYPLLDPGRGYSLGVFIPNISSLVQVRGVEVTLWGVPGDPAHDRLRYFNGLPGTNPVLGAPFVDAPIRPLLTNAMDCGISNGGARIQLDSYSRRREFTPVEESPRPDDVTGCDDPRVRFDPRISVRPTSNEKAAPAGLDVHIQSPLRGDQVNEARELYAENGYLKGIATPPMRRVVIRLPEGMTVSTSAAEGLTSCAESDVGFGEMSPASCAESSRLGSVSIATPILPSPLEGPVYLATQSENPFGALLAAYLVAEAEGIRVKLPVKLDLDPASGWIAIVLDDLPQLPFSEIELHLKSGPRAVLRTPDACGTYTTHYKVTSWADQSAVEGASSFDLQQGCDRGSGFQPTFSAGSINASAGAHSAFVLGLTREDREPNLSHFSMTLPAGLAADFASVPLCSESVAETGACPFASRVGSVTIAAGAGPSPVWIPEAGKPPTGIYLAGPYRGAPFSLVLVVPAQAGPFDLGSIVTRAAIQFDPAMAQAKIVADPLPQIFAGIPIDYRTVRLVLDRPDFIRNPTSCAEMHIAGSATSTTGATVVLGQRFQVADCDALPFRPWLALKLSGGLAQNGHPLLRAVLRARPGEADIAAAAFTLPAGELLDFRHLRALCRRGVPAERCPSGSRFGYVRTWSPLAKEPLEGPIYLREPAQRLPNLVAELRGGGVHLLLHGRIAAPRGRLRVRFGDLPDVPLRKTVITLAGGRRGLLVNSKALCARRLLANARFSAHSGKRRLLHPQVRLHGTC